MLGTEAQKIAAELEERLNAGSSAGPPTTGTQITVTVRKEELSPKSVPAGAGRPTFARYFIHIEDPARMATLSLGQAAALLEDVEPGWDADRLFDAIRGLEVPVKQAP